MNDVSGTNKIKINSYICVIDISFFYFLLYIAAIRNLLIKNDIEILAELTEGGSAVQRVETLKPDIVIIDVDIPGVNGIQVLETLRKRQYSGIIIIVSAKNDHFYGKHCADAGANGFVSKKEGMNNIIAAIDH